ncbi:response regulator [Mangrovihabitans endophyticus]|uniref:Response regulatory domain-containing protein n=1 Tax=Mangrovihabitans endophyticus TaxID=1751298 RepID=A0A8J3FPN7_9ACTN|nr:response regulator [Mangrovihabitans endophyticus]GGK94207.1 hypothetical protein GCM10012284_30380 [Mangrovihabitans endophyticus]
MTTELSEDRSILLVEDNPGDAELVANFLLDGPADREEFTVTSAASLAQALRHLDDADFDAVLLDLSLPDGRGADVVAAILDAGHIVPIVVLTGLEDEQMAWECMTRGAQDFLLKDEMTALSVRRSLGYAIYRRRLERQRAADETRARYRSLSTQTSTTVVTASMAGAGPLAERLPAVYTRAVADYVDLVEEYVDAVFSKKGKPHDAMQVLATRIGTLGGGPRDLLDIHLAAVDRLCAVRPPRRAHILTLEGRLLGLEMMGLLVDHYRVGSSRYHDYGVPR